MEYAKSYFAPSNEILNAALILYNNVNFTQLLDSEYLPNSDGKLNGSLWLSQKPWNDTHEWFLQDQVGVAI